MNTVCLATYNGEKYIKEQIESILSQIATNDELVISDDGSSDDTIKIINSFNDKRIKLYINTGKHGFKFNFQNALMHAKGTFIFLSDQDDVWFPNKYKTMLVYLADYNLVHHNSELTNSQLVPYNKTLYEECNNGSGFIHNLKKNTFYGSHIAFHSSLLKDILPFPKTLEMGHDVWIGFVCMMIGKIIFIKDKLMYYRRHEGAYCAFFKSNRPIYKKLLTRIVIFSHEIKFILCHMKKILFKHS